MKLEGLRVLDLSRFLPGPHLAMMMADHGADVIKIEDPRSGDPARAIGPVEGGHTVYFRNANRGKRSLAVDLKSEAGREAFMRLAGSADVILETFRPGVVDRPRHRLRRRAGAGAADRLRLDLGLRPVGALPRPAGPTTSASMRSPASPASASTTAASRPWRACLPPTWGAR